LFESYFGLVEATLVFGLAIAFYFWQRHDLRKAREKTRLRKQAREAERKSDDS
jgi:Flp pilus assembly protein TadB